MTQNRELRAELLRRFERDQEARTAGFETMTRIDAENLPWLKQVIAESGWPGHSAAGVEGPTPPGCSPSTPTPTRRSNGTVSTC